MIKEPNVTRLRYVRSTDPDLFQVWLDQLGVRVQIYSMNYDNKKWYLWFVPGDGAADIKSIDLDEV